MTREQFDALYAKEIAAGRISDRGASYRNTLWNRLKGGNINSAIIKYQQGLDFGETPTETVPGEVEVESTGIDERLRDPDYAALPPRVQAWIEDQLTNNPDLELLDVGNGQIILRNPFIGEDQVLSYNADGSSILPSKLLTGGTASASTLASANLVNMQAEQLQKLFNGEAIDLGSGFTLIPGTGQIVDMSRPGDFKPVVGMPNIVVDAVTGTIVDNNGNILARDIYEFESGAQFQEFHDQHADNLEEAVRQFNTTTTETQRQFDAEFDVQQKQWNADLNESARQDDNTQKRTAVSDAGNLAARQAELNSNNLNTLASLTANPGDFIQAETTRRGLEGQNVRGDGTNFADQSTLSDLVQRLAAFGDSGFTERGEGTDVGAGVTAPRAASSTDSIFERRTNLSDMVNEQVAPAAQASETAPMFSSEELRAALNAAAPTAKVDNITPNLTPEQIAQFYANGPASGYNSNPDGVGKGTVAPVTPMGTSSTNPTVSQAPGINPINGQIVDPRTGTPGFGSITVDPRTGTPGFGTLPPPVDPVTGQPFSLDSAGTRLNKGGVTNLSQFLVGDEPDGSPNDTEEGIINPTNAPIAVVNNKDLKRGKLSRFFRGTSENPWMPQTVISPTDSVIGEPANPLPGTRSNSNEAINQTPGLSVLRGDPGSRDAFNRLSTAVTSGAFGTQVPLAGRINARDALAIRDDPLTHGLLSSIYASASQNLDSELNRAIARAPKGRAQAGSTVRT